DPRRPDDGATPDPADGGDTGRTGADAVARAAAASRPAGSARSRFHSDDGAADAADHRDRLPGRRPQMDDGASRHLRMQAAPLGAPRWSARARAASVFAP